MNEMRKLAAPVGRVLISLIFLISGIQKITGFAGTRQYMESAGVPGILLYPTIALEVFGALAVILGWHARSAALLLAGFTLATAFIFHLQPADQMQMIMFMKNIAITGGFLFIVAYGPGPFSLGKNR